MRLRLGRRLQGRMLFPAKAILVARRTALQIDAKQRLQSFTGEFSGVQQNNRNIKLTRQLAMPNLMFNILPTPPPRFFPVSKINPSFRPYLKDKIQLFVQKKKTANNLTMEIIGFAVSRNTSLFKIEKQILHLG